MEDSEMLLKQKLKELNEMDPQVFASYRQGTTKE